MMMPRERAEAPPPLWKTLLRVFLVLVFLYLFLGGMAMMGEGLKTLGKNPDYDKHATEGPQSLEYRPVVYKVFKYAENPLVGLFVGVLMTSIFQSSSFTTSFTVGLVVTTPLTLPQAIFIIMGANIGTSVTNAGVSFTHIRRREEFERAYGAAIVHDFFNTLSVLLLFPLEWLVSWQTGKGLLERVSTWMASAFYSGAPTGQKPTNVLKEIVQPFVDVVARLLEDGLGLGHVSANLALMVLGVVFLFAALLLMTKVLRSLVMKRIEQFFDRVLFRNALTAYLVGLVLTATVQSSSITTSLAVPLAGAGLLTLRQIFPYTLGANLGTTVTALIASFAVAADTPAQAQIGMALAFSHMLFNIIGSVIWYPLKFVPIGMAKWWSHQASQSRYFAVLHITLFFFVLPVTVIGLYWLFG
ncbi:MAG: Na/Pi symporter [Phycisphaerae bacterium]|nr:Na/Pi symporter [Phycisphaerae bacterium]